MRFTKFLLILPVLFFFGCASTINYKLDKVSSTTKTEKVLVIDTFKDTRSEEEHIGLKGVGVDVLKSGDKDFKPNIPLQISSMLSKHLENSQIFRAVSQRDLGIGFVDNVEAIQKLSNEGFDIAITGNINHFSGYQTAPAIVGGLFGALGVITESIVNKKTVGAYVEYSDLKVIDLKTHEVLWQGNIESTFEKKVTMYEGPVAYALQGLKENNSKLEKKLLEIITTK